VHIAPEAELGRWLRKRCQLAGMDYRFGDIRDRKHHIDIESINLPSASVDVLFACHVLNMVRDDQRALREIARILKPYGTAVVTVPLSRPGAPMKEAGPESDTSARMELFADPDMRRVYTAAEFERRVLAAKLSLHTFAPGDVRDSSAALWALPDEPIQVMVRSPDPKGNA
jgi:SAM-dependent methyltransferase